MVLYAAVLLAGSMVSAFMWLYARRRGLIDPATPSRLVSRSLLRLLALPGLFVLSRRYGNLHDVVW